MIIIYEKDLNDANGIGREYNFACVFFGKFAIYCVFFNNFC